MPSTFSSSFASAAAADGDASSSRARGDGSGDWPRARTNGSTTTFRRPSLATNMSHQRDTSQSQASSTNQNSGIYVPPHMNSNHQTNQIRAGGSDTRYSRDQMLNLFRAQADGGSPAPDISDLYVDGWNPMPSRGMTNGGWSRKDEPEDNANGPEICWDHNGSVLPLGLSEMTEQEREVFSSSVNSPIRPLAQGTGKDSTPNPSAPGRRTSVTQNANSYNTPSPVSRPGNRRRESSEYPHNSLTSPTSTGRFAKEDNAATPPSSLLLRRRTDLRESLHEPVSEDKGEGKPLEGSSPFGGLKRTSTGPVNAGFGVSSSPWSTAPQSAGYSPMGAFGNFSLGALTGQPPTPSEKKTTYGSIRGESRFKGLMNSDNSDEISSKVKEKTSISSLERLAEASNESATAGRGGARIPQAAGAASQHDDRFQAGSAALGGDDASPPRKPPSRFGAPKASSSREDVGFSTFGGSSDMASFRELMQRREASQSQMNEPMSPTNTNPYQSPEAEKAVPRDVDADDSDFRNAQMATAAGHGHPSRIHTGQLDGSVSDQSRTSSAGASRGFPNLGTLGSLAGLGGSNTWSAAPGAVGTPGRVMPNSSIGFGETPFGALDELTSPLHGHAASSGFFGGVGNVGAIGRNSKMGSLFPSAMQDQMKGDQASNDTVEYTQRGIAGGNVMNANASVRGSDSISRPTRGNLDELFTNMDMNSRNPQNIASPFSQEPTPLGTGQTSQPSQTPLASAFAGTPALGTASNNSYFSKPQDPDNQSANQIPATQQRQMVMPDRMRWIYRDPTGNTQGPWSGLEMHDWYKAGFFSPELQVKKLEDADYEPLAQLIRRIGNSREPFLVPQIGIPHGSATALASSSAQAPGTTSTAPAAANSAQPPFASSFPSFGTTLTAEQQNALERRKQEEQYLMARQKEHLAQQQVIIKQQMHIQGGPHGMHSQQLHHHSSAHSLQSQPSYGSITSPTGYQPSPAQGPIQPPSAMSTFFDASRSGASNLMGMPPASEHLPPLREDDLPALMERLNAQRTAPMNYGGPFHPAGYQDEAMHQRQVQQMLLDRQRLLREQEEYGMIPPGQDEARQTAERLEQFKYLRPPMGDQPSAHQSMPPSGPAQRILNQHASSQHVDQDNVDEQAPSEAPPQKVREPLSLSEQVQKAVKESPAVQPQSSWARVESGLPQPFPPPQSSSPLPAPAAQRNRQNVADALNAESRSATHTPSVDTPSASSMAPWAKENHEGTKGPSLKEIQAVEALKAAKQEEIASVARRQLLEQERQNQQQPQVTPAPGLPSSANWANSISPAVPGTSAWAKPHASKTAVATPVPATKKTLDQIQKEEEARKKRVAASAAAASAANNAINSAAASAGGKRYADLAGKAPQTNAAQSQSNQAWTTVGAGGKVKTPTGPAPVPVRALSTTGNAQPTATAASKAKVAGKSVDKQGAQDELQKWTRTALSKGLNVGIPGQLILPILSSSSSPIQGSAYIADSDENVQVDDFTSQLLLLPAEMDIISDSIYAASQTLDGRRFAE
ncbi:MAG: hypothetical protein Q9228_005524, partial [Teloschistes exilis]